MPEGSVPTIDNRSPACGFVNVAVSDVRVALSVSRISPFAAAMDRGAPFSTYDVE